MLTTDARGRMCWVNTFRRGPQFSLERSPGSTPKVLHFPRKAGPQCVVIPFPGKSSRKRLAALPTDLPFTFSRPEADSIMTKAFCQICFLRRNRDYRLLELVVPSLRGVFDDAGGLGTVRTLSSTLNRRPDAQLFDAIAVERAEFLGVSGACRYLRGFAIGIALTAILSSERQIAGTIRKECRGRSQFGKLVSFVWAPFSPHARELRKLYRIGRGNLQNDPAICETVKSFLYGHAAMSK